MPTTQSETPFRSGYVAIVGRPNVGKSTLVNRLLGHELCIVSPRPQTTWHRILGIKNLPGAQMLFLDTPGIHQSEAPFNRNLIRVAERALADADVIVWLTDATETEHPDDALILDAIRRQRPNAAVLLAPNKVDRVAKPRLLPIIARWQTVRDFAEIVPISALKGDNVDRLESLLVQSLPVGHPFYPPEDLSDRPERFFIAENLRGQIFALLHHELPYSAAVEVEAVRAREGTDLTDVEATIYVERESQKGIVIGAGGAMLKRIGTAARPAIAELLGTRVFLKLHVKVAAAWRKNPNALRRLGYSEP
ncbi:MAG: GTPase Era [candidate division NC10 bacterium RBG_16_65_8]|nr:MAG: GTPase Era [candidate division NC10 bacterium RBG_16_65_8]